MNTKFALIGAVLLIGASVTLRAQDTNSTSMQSLNSPPNQSYEERVQRLYNDNELTIEGFGFGTVSEYTLDHLSGHRVADHSRLGLGAGAEYFFNRYIGVEGEGFSEGTHHSFVDDGGGHLVLRLPIGETGLAPYIFGGGGHEFDPAPGTYVDGGAGLEFRFTPHLGIFADGRYVVARRINDYGLARLGFRFTF